MEALKSLYEKRARVYSQMKDVAAKWEEDNKTNQAHDPESVRQYDLWDKEFEQYDAEIKRFEKFQAIDAQDNNKQPEKAEQKDRKAQYSEAFRNYVTKGSAALNAAEVELMAENR